MPQRRADTLPHGSHKFGVGSKRRNLGYRDLAEKLTAMGIPETEANIKNKISRGGFTAVFLIQCLVAIGCTSLRLEDS